MYRQVCKTILPQGRVRLFLIKQNMYHHVVHAWVHWAFTGELKTYMQTKPCTWVLTAAPNSNSRRLEAMFFHGCTVQQMMTCVSHDILASQKELGWVWKDFFWAKEMPKNLHNVCSSSVSLLKWSWAAQLLSRTQGPVVCFKQLTPFSQDQQRCHEGGREETWVPAVHVLW